MKKTTYKLLTILLFIAGLAEGKAQTNYEDVVYLKNGSVIRGVLIEQIPNVSLKIQTKDNNVFVYKIDEVLKIAKELPPQTPNNIYNSNSNNEPIGRVPIDYKKSGYTNISELVIGIGSDKSFGFQTINGLQLTPITFVGVGVGIDKYNIATMLPIFFDIRFNFLKKDISPYYNLGIGYALNLSGGGGYFGNSDIGLRFFVSPKVALNASLGYRVQRNTVMGGWPYYSEIIQEFNFLTLKFGATF